MDEEFKLCWKNFQDNIASGFQNLFDRGDLVDVTLACDGRLLQAHKFVLAICSPYFQEIFIKNPCRHPTIVLKDVSYNIMCELLEFMYQGVVNVKHTELQTFMKIGQELQIKGLATNSSASSASSQNSPNHNNNAQTDQTNPDDENTADKAEKSKDMKSSTTSEKEDTIKTETNKRTQSPAQSMPSPVNTKSSNDNNTDQEQQQQQQQQQQSNSKASSGSKRHLSTPDYNSETLSVLNRSKIRRSMASVEDMNENMTGNSMSAGGGGNNSMDHMTPDDFFFPHISMTESRYDIMKRDVDNSSDSHHSQQHTHPHHHHHHHHQGPSHHSNQPSAAAVAAAASLRSSFPPGTFGLDYAFYKNNSASSSSQQEYPNELHGDFSRNIGNHMDIPPTDCPNIVMLTSTSIVHGNFVFNRNNTVATQQGLKTYWLCKSYRVNMCRARCITYQGKIISATGVHNHAPHMGNNSTASGGNLNRGTASSSAHHAAGSGNVPSIPNTINNSNMFASNSSSSHFSASNIQHLSQAMPNLLIQPQRIPNMGILEPQILMHTESDTGGNMHHSRQSNFQMQSGGNKNIVSDNIPVVNEALTPPQLETAQNNNEREAQHHSLNNSPNASQEHQQQQQQQQQHQQQESQQQHQQQQLHHHPIHVIDSITLPTTHNFKLENL